jgi:ribosome recycling factor
MLQRFGRTVGTTAFTSGRRSLPQLASFIDTAVTREHTLQVPQQQQPLRSFHSSLSVAAKAKVKGSKSDADDSGAAVQLPSAKTMEPKMDRVVVKLEEEYEKHRVGKINSSMFGDLSVSKLGPINGLGQVTVKSPTKLSISIFDLTTVPMVVDAIKQNGMGLQPTVENGTILVNIPKPSKEARNAMVKLIGKFAEKAKQDIRQIRKEYLDSVKKVKKSVSEDDVKKASKEADVITEKKISKVMQVTKQKDTEIQSA